jgi:nitrogen regulatory protein PII
MFEVKAIVRRDRQETVIAALHAMADLPGLTLSNVEGIGRRHSDRSEGAGEFARATMVKLEIVVEEAQLEAVLDAIGRSAHTGRHGDGKVFVSRIERVVRVRTGETGTDALN